MENEKLQLNPSTDDLMDGRTYPMGMDPIWALADNKILFLNSFKMKLSIIFGVVHMILGVCVSVINYNHFRRRISILLEFLPQIIFLVLLFGYLVFMMFWKWVRFDPKSEQPYSPGCAPSVLVYFINMMLFGDNKPLPGCDEYMYSGQYLVQLVCVLVGVLCIPWMLIGKPIYISCTRKSHPQAVAEFNHEAGTSEKRQEVPAENDHENEPMSEIWTHQAIHTIEYILGTVSHTASYLRLWALSLAHAREFINRNFKQDLNKFSFSRTVRSFVEQRDAFGIHESSLRCPGSPLHRFLPLVVPDIRNPNHHRRHVGVSAHVAPPLGGVHEQVLRWNGREVPAVLLQSDSKRRRLKTR